MRKGILYHNVPNIIRVHDPVKLMMWVFKNHHKMDIVQLQYHGLYPLFAKAFIQAICKDFPDAVKEAL